MPDHIHMLRGGLAADSDQLTAMQRFRLDMNDSLRRIGYEFQKQPYDHVLQDAELEHNSLESTAEYIARNPERRGLVPQDQFAKYAYTGCLLPAAPRLRLYRGSKWDEIWRTVSFLKKSECFRKEVSYNANHRVPQA